jgi:hypothetical protein
LVFLVASISDDRDLAVNINARYSVESVEITGVPETDVSQGIRDDLQRLIGRPLDHDEAERLEKRIDAELPGFEVKRRISRGSQPGRIRVIFELIKIEPPPWIPFDRDRSKIVYHSKQGWSGVLDIPMGGPRHHRVRLGMVFDNNDDLIEEYAGFNFGFESRKVATDRLGVTVEVSRYRQSWRPETLLALELNPSIPAPYRSRLTLEPLVTFAFHPHLRLTGGISISELESLSRSPQSEMANTAVMSLAYDQRLHRSDVEVGYELRSATTALDSDLLYKRHFGRARFQYEHNNHVILATASAGRITGQAPLVERFTLGDSSTLRGWSKFDIAPAGGDRMFYQSLEYRFHHFALFVDTGSVWDHGADARIRVAGGLGLHGRNGFLTLGFPLTAGGTGAIFLMGVRF